MDVYLNKRANLIDADQSQWADTKLRMSLSQKEQDLNRRMKEHRRKELELFKQRTDGFLPAQASILDIQAYLKEYADQNVWSMLKCMPKGAVLHAHIDSMVDIHWLIQYATYNPMCYMHTCSETNRLTFRFFAQDPNTSLKSMDDEHFHEKWIQVQQARQSHQQGLVAFDTMLYEGLTLTREIRQGIASIPDQEVWNRFLQTFLAAGGLINYAPVFKAYMKHKLETLISDGVLYLEERMVGVATQLYDEHGTVFPLTYTLRVYEEVTREVAGVHPDALVGAKLIYSGLKVGDAESVKADVEQVLALKREFPHVIAGFDLVGYEDEGSSLLDFAPILLDMRQKCVEQQLHIPFVWHAGETLNTGGSADQNVYDALMLGTKRIGHGLSLVHHPRLLDMIKQRNIAIELCPISNKVLKFMPSDLRLHPLNSFIAYGVPVVLSPDDPAIFGVGEHPASYDFWVSFMTWERLDLASLKMLALNSLEHALLSEQERSHARSIWQRQWDAWVDKMLS